MKTQIDEITECIYRFSTFIPEIAAPAGFTFNQYLIDAKEPLLSTERRKEGVRIPLGRAADHWNPICTLGGNFFNTAL